MNWWLYIWLSVPSAHDPGGGYWKAVCYCLDAESLGIVRRALEGAGQRVRVVEGH